MKRATLTFVVWFAFMLAGVTAASLIPVDAQSKTPQPTAEQQRQLVDIVQAINQANQESRDVTTCQVAAKARAETAQQRLVSKIYEVMAELGVKPSEYAPKFSDQGLSFERIAKPTPAAASSPAAKPGATP